MKHNRKAHISGGTPMWTDVSVNDTYKRKHFDISTSNGMTSSFFNGNCRHHKTRCYFERSDGNG